MTREAVTKQFLESRIREEYGSPDIEIVFMSPPRGVNSNGANWNAAPQTRLPGGKAIDTAGFARAGEIVRRLQAKFDLLD